MWCLDWFEEVWVFKEYFQGDVWVVFDMVSQIVSGYVKVKFDVFVFSMGYVCQECCSGSGGY